MYNRSNLNGHNEPIPNMALADRDKNEGRRSLQQSKWLRDETMMISPPSPVAGRAVVVGSLVSLRQGLELLSPDETKNIGMKV